MVCYVSFTMISGYTTVLESLLFLILTHQVNSVAIATAKIVTTTSLMNPSELVPSRVPLNEILTLSNRK